MSTSEPGTPGGKFLSSIKWCGTQSARRRKKAGLSRMIWIEPLQRREFGAGVGGD
jgi:hypothetical protein